MKIRNFLNVPLVKERIHEGEGLCEHSGVFGGSDFDTPVRFVNYTIIPPNGSFGQHKHDDDNEMYIVLEGSGEYTQEGETAHVREGDIMINAPFASHGIENTGDVPMRLLVIAAYNK